MATKAKSAKKLPQLNFMEAPNEHRRQHSPFTRDILTPTGAPIVARHRARTLLTPLAARQAIIEDAATKPEPVRIRSLRRRLTVLDRALSDREAEALDRLTSCISGLSNVGCLNYLRSEVRSAPADRLPFSEGKRIEIAAMNAVLKGLSPVHKSAVLELAVLLDPSHSGSFKPAPEFVSLLQAAGAAACELYAEWFRTREGRPAAAAPLPPNNL
jgi:hypothetical protein